MVYWVSLTPGWKLQDVQAGLNVVIALTCAGCIFVLVRYCWLLAARRVTREQEVSASSLLSLNTIGETIDVIWLLRKDLLKRPYHGLLLQCICVMLLTIAALTSGFIARFSTRYGTILIAQQTNGSIAERLTGSIPYAEVDTNATLYSLKNANFPQDQLLEYLPDISKHWEYEKDQWNSSWRLDCAYENETEVPNLSTTGNCSGLLSEIPQVNNNWKDWDVNASWSWDYTGWRNTFTEYRDILLFSHGIEYGALNEALDNTWTAGRIRTVAMHLEGVPYNTSLSQTYCNFAKGPIRRVSYTSMTCKMTRDVAGMTKENAYWGAFPDAYDLGIQTTAYLQHYANRFRRESSLEQNITVITGPELAMFYQAYLVTKDTTTSPFVKRNISVHVQVTQLSLPCLVVCAIAMCFILFGLIHYWIFLFQHSNFAKEAPQSKLDWVMKSLLRDGDDSKTGHNYSASMRQRLKQAMTSGKHKTFRDLEDTVPLTDMNSNVKNRLSPNNNAAAADRRSIKSVASSTTTFPTPEFDQPGDDGFETPILGANFSGARPGVPWFPTAQIGQTQQYQSVAGGAGGGGHGRQSSFGLGFDYGRGASTGMQGGDDYNPVQGRYEDRRGTRNWAGTHHVDTTYDPGRW